MEQSNQRHSSAKIDLWRFLSQPGDVVLSSGRSAASHANRLSQSLMRGKYTRFSHVAISLGEGLLVHATNLKGVEVVHYSDYLAAFDGKYCAFRHPQLTSLYSTDPFLAMRRCLYFMGQEYVTELTSKATFDINVLKKLTNARLGFGETICSKLVADFLAEHGLSSFRSNGVPFPVDFQKLMKDEPWEDVSIRHKVHYAILDHFLGHKKNFHTFLNDLEATIKTTRELDKRRDDLIARVDSLQEALDGFPEAAERINEMNTKSGNDVLKWSRDIKTNGLAWGQTQKNSSTSALWDLKYGDLGSRPFVEDLARAPDIEGK